VREEHHSRFPGRGGPRGVRGKVIPRFFFLSPGRPLSWKGIHVGGLRDFRGRVFPGGPALCQGEFIRGVTGLADGLFTP